ncbi:MAG TPA: hypothetical protein VGM42_05935 [Rhodopila sp.]|jgi:hypothetical protein
MSRSGTSLLAHVLHVLGATLPKDMLGAGPGNPLGHFEPKALMELNDRILASLDRRWDDPRPIPPRWFRSRKAYQFMRRIVDQIRRDYGDAPILVIKDPRLCRLAPLYFEALDVLDIEPLVVLQTRPVAEVVRSLADRDGKQSGLVEFLWLRSLLEAEAHSRNCRRVWSSMDRIMTDWPETVRRITDGLGLEWPMERHEAMGEIGPLLKPRLNHGAAPEPFEATMPLLSTATWAAVDQALAGNEAAARASFDGLRAVLADFDQMHAHYAPAAQRRSLGGRLSARLGSLRRAYQRM